METVDQQPQTVRKPWQFQPGVCPNPKGRPRKTDAQRAAEIVTRQAAQKAIENLLGKAVIVVEKALKSKDANVGLRAALEVLDRGVGKAMQRIEGTFTGPETVTQVTPEMLKLAAQRLLAAQAVDVETRSPE